MVLVSPSVRRVKDIPVGEPGEKTRLRLDIGTIVGGIEPIVNRLVYPRNFFRISLVKPKDRIPRKVGYGNGSIGHERRAIVVNLSIQECSFGEKLGEKFLLDVVECKDTWDGHRPRVQIGERTKIQVQVTKVFPDYTSMGDPYTIIFPSRILELVELFDVIIGIKEDICVPVVSPV